MLDYKLLLKLFLRRYGVNIERSARFRKPIFSVLATDLVLDVGANSGQFARSIRSNFYKNRIVSFEPLSLAHSRLLKNSSGDKKWTIHPRCAVGAFRQTLTLNVSENSVSSSLLQMLPMHLDAAPNSKYFDSELVEVLPLDDVFSTYAQKGDSVFLKIDAQGYEAQILEGAKASLPNIKGIQVELSLIPLYQGQETIEYFLDFFQQHNYRLWDLLPGFYDKDSGRLLQIDGVFVKD